MRLKPLSPDDLSQEQLPLYKSMKAGVEAHLKGFISKRSGGALICPYNPMLHFPHFGSAAWTYTTALIQNLTLPKPAQ